jgi:hypothetical protein
MKLTNDSTRVAMIPQPDEMNPFEEFMAAREGNWVDTWIDHQSPGNIENVISVLQGNGEDQLAQKLSTCFLEGIPWVE